MGGRLAAVVRTRGRPAGTMGRAARLVVIVIVAVCMVGGPAVPGR